MRAHARTLLVSAALTLACGSDPTNEPDTTPDPPWQPGTVYRTAETANARGLLDRRGLIHAHSVYSHDACDGEPRDENDQIDEACFADFRRDLCAVGHDFVFLTDHGESFARTEFPEVLLHRPQDGDELLERGGAPVANRLACPDASPALVMAGNESAQMPVGLEHHVGATEAERDAVYGETSADTLDALTAAGAVVLAQHTEDWTPEQLETLPFGGFEMYNLHANVITGAGGLLSLLGRLNFPEQLPHPDISLLPIVNEDTRYLERWGTVLARGARRTTTIGTDCHRNTLPELLPDGERMDSYRRMMLWMSNHLLVAPAVDGGFTDLELKDALRSGRLYGAFEVLGYPVGFDYHALEGESVIEMGGVAAAGTELRVTLPSVQNLDPAVEPPRITARLLRAREGGWDLVTESDQDLVHAATEPGAYRAEIRIEPRHLRALLASYSDLADQSFVWIYANAIYVE
jgi:hypothetical protein